MLKMLKVVGVLTPPPPTKAEKKTWLKPGKVENVKNVKGIPTKKVLKTR